MRKLFMTILISLLLAMPSLASAQDANKPVETPHNFHLTFVTRELDESGKLVNARQYSTLVFGNHFCQIRTGDKFPIHTNDAKGEIQYVDIGVNIDCHDIKEIANGISLHVEAEISSVAKPGDEHDPIIRSNRWGSDVLVQAGKPTIIMSSDHLEDKGKIQLELTATRID